MRKQKQQSQVVKRLSTLAIPVLAVAGLIKCGDDKKSDTPTTNNNATPDSTVDGYLMLGFNLPAASTLLGSLDTSANGNNALAAVSATELYGSYSSGALPSGVTGTDSFGFALPLKPTTTTGTKNILFAFRGTGVYPSSAGTAINSVNFNVTVADKSFASDKLGTVLLDNTNKTAFQLTDLSSGTQTEFGAPGKVGSNLNGVAFLPAAATATGWGKANLIPKVVYTSVSASTTGFMSAAPATGSAQYSNILLAPKIAGTNFDGTKAKANVTIAVLAATDFAAGIYSPTAADASAGKFDTPVNGFSVSVTDTTITTSPGTLIVPNLAGAVMAQNTGICAGAPTSGGIPGGVGSFKSAGATLTFKGNIWVPNGGEKRLALFIPKLNSAAVVPLANTIQFQVGSATSSTSFAYKGGGSSAWSALSGTNSDPITNTGDLLYVSTTDMTQGQWNPVVITFTNPTTGVECNGTTNKLAGLILATTNGIAGSTGTTPLDASTNVPGTATTLNASAISVLSSGALGTPPTASAAISSTRIRFVAPQ